MGFKRVLPVLLALFALCATSQQAFAVPAPRIDAQQTSGLNVRIKTVLSAKVSRRKAHLIIAQSMDGSHYATVTVIRNPGRLNHLSVVEPQLPVWFRARVIDGRNVSKWTYSVAIDEDFGNSLPEVLLPGAPNAPLTLDTAIPSGMSKCPSDFAARVLAAVNTARVQNALAPLALEDHLGLAALAHSIRMAKSGSMVHDNWFEEILASGFVGSHFGQNIAAQFNNPETVVAAWLASPGHRDNILSPKYTGLGVGCVIDRGGAAWWSQDFGG